jgi:hypothetical protein
VVVFAVLARVARKLRVSRWGVHGFPGHA